MRNPEGFEPRRFFEHLISIGIELDEFDFLLDTRFLELFTDQPAGETGGVDGSLDLAQQIGERADMVLMTVGDEDAS